VNDLDLKNHGQLPSLRPYLEPGGTKFHLMFSLASQGTSFQDKSSVPFLVINESDPLAHLIEAQFVTDARSEIKRVFILLQNDEYFLPRDELWPVNNEDIDQWWQRAFSFYSGKSKDGSVFVLYDQVRKDGGLLPFQSLFFCKQEQVFFDPPCTTCGSPLQQCYDDNLLTGFGLQPYSTSLKRYLFCPTCFDLVGKSDFYVFALESSDPPILKDRRDLIKEFGQLTEDKGRLTLFPCAGCPNHQACYGPDGLAVSSIVPVAFYPFFMLIFEAMSVNAAEFLSLISGASFEELEDHLSKKQALGRMHCLKALKRNDLVKTPFFFDREEKYFLEVLYLKLSFLGELVQTISSGLETYEYPDLALSLDRVWVNLTDQGGLLPFFWNFKVQPIEIGGTAAKRSFLPKLPPSYGLHFLGLVWFYSLLVNKKQGVSKVYAALGKAVERIAARDGSTFNSLIENELSRPYSPENIFWDPEGKGVNQGWWLLWEESLALGWSLLEASLSTDSKWSKDGFWKRLMELREEVKGNLFQPGPVMDGRPKAAPDNKAIHDILVKIMEKWRGDFETEKEIARQDVSEEDEFEKTVISTADVEGLDKAVDVPQAEELDILETVILSPEDLKQEPSPPGEMSKTKQDDIPETVILSPHGRSGTALRPSQPLPTKDSDLEKGQGPLDEAPESLGYDKKKTDEPEEDFLAQTVVLSPDKLGDKE
jgi:hypothetical protein